MTLRRLLAIKDAMHAIGRYRIDFGIDRTQSALRANF